MKALMSSIVIGSLLMTGCKTFDLGDASPAVAVDISQSAVNEIATIINQEMPGANVKLANDIFESDHRLFIQNKTTLVDGNPAQGRITEMPRKFELYRYEEHCYLVDSKTNKDFLLTLMECKSKP